MTTRTPRVQRVWDWLTGTRAQRSTYWLILGPTIGLTHWCRDGRICFFCRSYWRCGSLLR